MNRLIWISLVAAWSLAMDAALVGQEPFEGRRNRWSAGGESGGRDRGDRMARMEFFLQSLDTDGNGIIEPAEVPPERARIVQFFASRLELDPSQPIPIARIREALGARMSSGSEANSSSAPSAAGGGLPEKKPDPPNAGQPAKGEPPPLVPGFGAAEVPGFGITALASPTPTTPGSSVPVSTPPGSSALGSQSTDPRRAFREARFRRYDRNGDGVLDKDERSGLPSDSAAMADRNHDGRITLEEYLAISLQARPPEQVAPENSGGGPSLVKEKLEKDARKSYRFLQPQERLPAGLPAWFTERDTNQDGQVSMAEYASLWSDGTAGEFGQMDLNGDGFLTPRECLEGGASQPGEGGTLSESGASSGSPSSTPAPSGKGSDKSKFWWLRE